ncbi:hypothetical protein [Frigidibacter mobilis]|uniref:hypothetical protein n=1 Tax=Frigidibacter mobilis TaxID=1335048 RepID=UPI00141234BF|nr:hypothetical protein [Frigidibacter mobilis]
MPLADHTLKPAAGRAAFGKPFEFKGYVSGHHVTSYMKSRDSIEVSSNGPLA